MAKSMTKSQIADHLAGKAGITKKTAVQFLDDFAALATGQMNPMNGFLQGRIKVQGNIMMATKLQSLF